MSSILCSLRIGVTKHVFFMAFLTTMVSCSVSKIGAPNDYHWILYHKFSSNADYVPRGDLILQSFDGCFKATLRQKSLSDADKKHLLTTNNERYFLKLFPRDIDNYVMSSLPVDMLVESRFNDHIDITMGPDRTPIGITMRPKPQHGEILVGAVKRFNTSVSVRCATAGARVNTKPYLEHLERERLASRSHPDSRSFFSRYWIYIVAFGILTLISSAAAPPPPHAANERTTTHPLLQDSHHSPISPGFIGASGEIVTQPSQQH